MSLKAFHIVFVIFSTLLAIGTGAWCLWVDLVAGAPLYLAGAIASFAAAVALIIYGVWFYKNMKRLRIITCKVSFLFREAFGNGAGSLRSCCCRFHSARSKRWRARFATGQRTENRPSTWPSPSGFSLAPCCR